MISPMERKDVPKCYTCYRHPKLLVQQHMSGMNPFAKSLIVDLVRPFKGRVFEILLQPEENVAAIYELHRRPDYCDLDWVRNIGGWYLHLDSCPQISPENIDQKLQMWITFS